MSGTMYSNVFTFMLQRDSITLENNNQNSNHQFPGLPHNIYHLQNHGRNLQWITTFPDSQTVQNIA